METPEEIEGKSLVHWQTWRESYDDLCLGISGDDDIRKDVDSLVKSIQKIP